MVTVFDPESLQDFETSIVLLEGERHLVDAVAGNDLLKQSLGIASMSGSFVKEPDDCFVK